MKKALLFLSLAAVSLAGLPEISEAKKKYRYIKRAHGVKLLHGGYDIMFGGDGNLSLSGAYAWNWKGLIETGPYFSLGVTVPPSFAISGWSAGLGIEYNFIKNRGKRKLIPALGIKLGAKAKNRDDGEVVYPLSGNVEPVFTLKSFVSKRTAFLTSLSYALGIPGFTNFQGLYHNVGIKLGFAHYFDF